MKKIILTILLLINSVANAAVGDVPLVQYVNPFQTIQYLFNGSAGDCVLSISAANVPSCIPIGVGLSYGPSSLTTSPINSTQVVSALGYTPYSTSNPNGFVTATDLATKFNIPSGTTAQYIRGDGSLSTLPVAPIVNRAVVTTATDGTYIWTLPTACSGIPAVSVTPQNSTSSEVINHKITAVSATSVSISLSRAVLTLNGLLGLTIPIIQTSPGAQTVHLIAVCP